jgi:hypothetical protein
VKFHRARYSGCGIQALYTCPMAGARKRRTVRAACRRARRTIENALARERAEEKAAEAEEAPIPRVARHVDRLDFLLMRGAVSEDQAKAGGRFCRDYEKSNTLPGRLVGRYETNLPKPKGRHQEPAETLTAIAARARFERACHALGPLAGIVIHVAITDQPPESWGVRPGSQNGDAPAVLRLGLAVLVEYYGRRCNGITTAGEPRAIPRAAHSLESAPAAP